MKRKCDCSVGHFGERINKNVRSETRIVFLAKETPPHSDRRFELLPQDTCPFLEEYRNAGEPTVKYFAN